MPHKNFSRILARIVGMTGWAVLPLAAQTLDPAPPPEVPFQGRLLQNGSNADGLHAFLFQVIATDAAGTETELYNSGTVQVTVSGGLYSVLLGGAGMPPMDPSVGGRAGLKIRVTIDGSLMTPDEPLTPELQALSAWTVNGAFGGDLKGNQSQISIASLQGVPVDFSAAPAAGQVIAFNGTALVPTTVAGTAGPAGTRSQSPRRVAGNSFCSLMARANSA